MLRISSSLNGNLRFFSSFAVAPVLRAEHQGNPFYIRDIPKQPEPVSVPKTANGAAPARLEKIDTRTTQQMVEAQEWIVVDKEQVMCDGGHPFAGHPRNFISLRTPVAKACGYCSTRFVQRKFLEEAKKHPVVYDV